MTKKRGAGGASTQQPKRGRWSKAKIELTFPLLDLPAEVLDIFLGHVVVVPWHAINARYTDMALVDLFTPSALHINRHLREKSLEIIAKRCL